MLALDRPLGVVGDLVLFGDHADPSRVYWAATRPSLARVGATSEISFVKFRSADAADGGIGLLSFTAELVASESALEEARRHCVRQGVNEPRLVQFPWRAGRAVLAAALKEGHGFVEQLLGTTTPDLVAANRAVFSMRLTQQGAALVEALLAAGGDDVVPSPIGVRYELEYAGIQPALQVKLVADYKRVYDELSWGFQAGVAYSGVGVRAGVESATKKLREQGAIQIEVLQFSDSEDLRRRVDEAVKWFQEKVVNDFFKSHMQPPAGNDLLQRALQAATAMGASGLGSALADASMAAKLAEQLGIPLDILKQLGAGQQPAGAGSGGESTFSLNLQLTFKDIHQDELVTIELDWSEAHAETRTAAPQGLLATMGLPPVVVEASDAGTFWQQLDVDVRTLGDFAALGVQRLVAELGYPDEHAPSKTVLTFEAGDAAPQHFTAWTDGRPPEYRVRTDVHFAPDSAWRGPPQWSGEWTTSTALQLALHPLSNVPRLEVEIVPGTLSFIDTPQTQIDTRIDARAGASYMLNAAQPRAMILQRLEPLPPPRPPEPVPEGVFAGPAVVAVSAPARLEARTTWFFADGPAVTGAWAPVDGTSLVVHAPWRSQRSLRLFPLLPADAIEASVTVTMTEGDRSRSVETRFEPGERKTKTVSLPSLAEQPPPVRIDVLVIRGDGSTFVGKPVETSDPVFIVRDRDGEHRQLRVRLLAAPQLAAQSLMAVAVELLGDDDTVVDTALFTQSQREPTTMLVPVGNDGVGRARYRIVRYGLDGTAQPGPIEETTAAELLALAAQSP